MIATVLTEIGVLFGVWRLVHVESESVRRDLAAQISAVNTRIDTTCYWPTGSAPRPKETAK